jgi:hypothetical protein
MPRKLGEVRTRDLIVLWGKAAGRCSHPECKKELVAEANGEDEAAAVGEAAHIVAAADDGPRGSAWEPPRIHGYENLILLCAHHHSVIDRQAKSHSVETLRAWKTEHEAWVAAMMAPRPEAPWTAIVQDPAGRADAEEAARALGPGNCVAELVDLGGDHQAQGWAEAARHVWRTVELTVSRTPAERRRFAVFSTGRIPLAVQLGYALGDRARVEAMHYDRDRGSWAWPEEGPVDQAQDAVLRVSGETSGAAGDEANLVVSLSARVDREDVTPRAVEVEIAAAEPSVRWLRERRQLKELARVYERALAAIRERRCRRVHLYYAGPAAGAVELGRAYNPRMNPPMQVYEYGQGGRPRYEAALVLNG